MDPVDVKDGFYLTQQEGIAVGQGIENLKADLAKLTKERDAYKTAYEDQVDITSEYSKLLKDMYLSYEMRVNVTKDIIDLYERKDILRKEQLNDMNKELIKHKTLNIGLIIALLATLL